MNVKLNKTVVLLTLFWFLAPNSLAQSQYNDSSFFEMSLEELMNIVVTPSKLPQTAGHVTQKIDVVRADDIALNVFANRNIAEAIAHLPGASVSVLSRNDANWGSYGGIGPKYSTYMLQGLPMDAFMDPLSLELNAVDHIEVQRGPASVIYPNYLSQDFAGSQSPLAGTVNFILIEKVNQPKTQFSTSYGAYNTFNGQIFHENSFHRLNFFGGTTYEISDYTNYGTPGSWLDMKKNPEYKKIKVYGGLTLFVDEREKQKFSVYWQRTGNIGDAGRIYRGFDHNYQTVNAGYNFELNERFYLQSQMGMRSYDRTWQNSVYGIIDTLQSGNGMNQVIVPFDISLSWKHSENNILNIGADYQGATYYTWADPLLGYRIILNKSSALQSGLYLQEEWRPFSQLLLRGGLRFAYVKNQIALVGGATPDINDVQWSNVLWSVGMRYSITDLVSVFANGGSSFVTPGLKSSGGTIPLSDLAIPGRSGQLPSPGLKPESGIGLDAGLDAVLTQNFKVNFRCFYTIVNNAIIDKVVCRNPSQTQSLNSGELSSIGGEFEVSHILSGAFSWFSNGTFTVTNSMNPSDDNENNVEIPFSPDFVFNLGGKVLLSNGFSASLALNYNSGFYDGISKSGRSFFKPGVILNSYIAQRFVSEQMYTVDGFIQLSNILDNQFELPWQFKNPGFSAMSGIKVMF